MEYTNPVHSQPSAEDAEVLGNLKETFKYRFEVVTRGIRDAKQRIDTLVDRGLELTIEIEQFGPNLSDRDKRAINDELAQIDREIEQQHSNIRQARVLAHESLDTWALFGQEAGPTGTSVSNQMLHRPSGDGSA